MQPQHTGGQQNKQQHRNHGSAGSDATDLVSLLKQKHGVQHSKCLQLFCLTALHPLGTFKSVWDLIILVLVRGTKLGLPPTTDAAA